MLPLIYLGNPILHKKTQVIKPAELISAKVQTFAKQLLDTIPHLPAAGLAAPQLGKSYRMFCIILEKQDLTYKSVSPTEQNIIKPNIAHLFVNPEIISHSNELITEEEACLSIPYYGGFVQRYASVTVSFQDLKGKKYAITANGFMARVLQHELDHLNGTLWLDRVRSPKEMFYLVPESDKNL